MELSNVEKLLEKYFEGETTLKEEQELRQYFLNDQVAPHLKQYESLFQYFTNDSKTHSAKEFVPTKTLKTKRNYKWVGVAASIALAIGVFYQQMPNQEELERQEAEYALQETKKLCS